MGLGGGHHRRLCSLSCCNQTSISFPFAFGNGRPLASGPFAVRSSKMEKRSVSWASPEGLSLLAQRPFYGFWSRLRWMAILASLRPIAPTPPRSVSNTYPVPGLGPPIWPGGQNIVHEIRGVFELLNSHEFKIQLFCPRGAQLWDPVRQGRLLVLVPFGLPTHI